MVAAAHTHTNTHTHICNDQVGIVHSHRQADRQTDRQANKQTGRHKCACTNTNNNTNTNTNTNTTNTHRIPQNLVTMNTVWFHTPNSLTVSMYCPTMASHSATIA